MLGADTDDDSKVLPGTQFEIKNSQGEVVTTITTDENGLAEAELVPGEYTSQEITNLLPKTGTSALPLLAGILMLAVGTLTLKKQKKTNR
nr:prealbumin-like fold domain-containing protein [Haloimpatiens lingqiaonensis]